MLPKWQNLVTLFARCEPASIENYDLHHQSLCKSPLPRGVVILKVFMKQTAWSITSMHSMKIWFECDCSNKYQWDKMWQLKTAQLFQKLPKKYPQQFNLKSDGFQNSPKGHQIFWLPPIVLKFVTKNFKKSPNLVTLRVPTIELQ